MKLSEQIEPYKTAAVKYLQDVYEGYYDADFEDLVVVEPSLLSEDDERVTYLYDVVDMYRKGKTNYQDTNDSDAIFEYVDWENLVSLLSPEELLTLMLNHPAIRELDAKYNYALHLEDKIINELRLKDPFDILSFANEYEYMIVHPSTGEVEFETDDLPNQDDCDCYDTDQFIKRGH